MVFGLRLPRIPDTLAPYWIKQKRMGHRLSKITTRTGDDGTTGLADGSRYPKDHPKVALLGELDELNSALGWLRTQALPAEADALLAEVQQRLFDLGGAVALSAAAPGPLDERTVATLEQALRDWNDCLPPLREFILPGGTPAAAICHLARAICRRVERQWVSTHRLETLHPHGLHYLNRLSDLLFVLARHLNQQAQQAEAQWRGWDHA